MGNTPSVESLKGFQILNVLPTSPAQDAQLTPYLDFIIKINNQFITKENATQLLQLISQQQPLTIVVYNSRSLSVVRKVIIPRIWRDDKDGLLGCNIRLASFDKAHLLIWHILEVVEDSPAYFAKLESNTYILGSPDGHYDEEYGFYQHVKDCADSKKPCQIYVYDPKSDSTRLVNVQPNYEWGGQGCLGADVGYGLLHRLVEEEPNFDELLQNSDENEPLLQQQTESSDMPANYVQEQSVELSVPQKTSAAENKIADPTEQLTKTIQQNHENISDTVKTKVQIQEGIKMEPIETVSYPNKSHNPSITPALPLGNKKESITSAPSIVTNGNKMTTSAASVPKKESPPIVKAVKSATDVSKTTQPAVPQPVRSHTLSAAKTKPFDTTAPAIESKDKPSTQDEWSHIADAKTEQTADMLFNDLSKPLEDELSDLLNGDLR